MKKNSHVNKLYIFIYFCFTDSFFCRAVAKGSRRECKHRSDDINNGLGILPLDYLDHGDGHLISINSFSGANRSLLLPKTSPASVFIYLSIYILSTNIVEE